MPVVFFPTTFAAHNAVLLSLILKMRNTGIFIGEILREIKDSHICKIYVSTYRKNIDYK